MVQFGFFTPIWCFRLDYTAISFSCQLQIYENIFEVLLISLKSRITTPITTYRSITQNTGIIRKISRGFPSNKLEIKRASEFPTYPKDTEGSGADLLCNRNTILVDFLL